MLCLFSIGLSSLHMACMIVDFLSLTHNDSLAKLLGNALCLITSVPLWLPSPAWIYIQGLQAAKPLQVSTDICYMLIIHSNIDLIHECLYEDGPSFYDSHIQYNELAPGGPNLVVSGWTPSGGSLDIVDLDAIDLQIRVVHESSRKPLLDKSRAWMNHAFAFDASALGFHPPAYAESPPDTSAADTSQHPYPKWPSNMELEPPAISDSYVDASMPPQAASPNIPCPSVLYAPTPVANSPSLYRNTVMMRSAAGRPVGGIPPIFARSVTSNIIKKERLKAQAKIDARDTDNATADLSQQTTCIPGKQQEAPVLALPSTSRGYVVAAQRPPKQIPNSLSNYAAKTSRPVIPIGHPNPASQALVTVDVNAIPQVVTGVRPRALANSNLPERLTESDVIDLKQYHSATREGQSGETDGYFWPIGTRVKRGLEGGCDAEGSAKRKFR